tara:strand:- start:449 stop:955 length:507 start_codon:yes stop_codon:yes gene_type:complete
MAKIKAAYGSFMNSYACGPEDTTYEETVGAGGSAADHTKIVNVVKNKCKVHAIYWLNTSGSETNVRLLDWNDGITTTISDIITQPINYATVVPRDASFSSTWDPDLGFWSAELTIAADLYDTPSGIYETFPKPGMTFVNGIGVYYKPVPTHYNDGADPETHWVIFYSE